MWAIIQPILAVFSYRTYVPQIVNEPAPVVQPTVQPVIYPLESNKTYYWLTDIPAILRVVGAPEEWIADLTVIAKCESGQTDPATKQWYVRSAVKGDNGNSLGAWQLWHGWFRDGEDPFDVYTNARVALRVREIRGRFGGQGGWSCADQNGIA